MKNKKSEIPEVQEAMKHVYHETRKDKLKNGLLNVVGCIGGFIAMVLVGIALSNLSDNDNIVGHFFSFLLKWWFPLLLVFLGLGALFTEVIAPFIEKRKKEKGENR